MPCLILVVMNVRDYYYSSHYTRYIISRILILASFSYECYELLMLLGFDFRYLTFVLCSGSKFHAKMPLHYLIWGHFSTSLLRCFDFNFGFHFNTHHITSKSISLSFWAILHFECFISSFRHVAMPDAVWICRGKATARKMWYYLQPFDSSATASAHCLMRIQDYFICKMPISIYRCRLMAKVLTEEFQSKPLPRWCLSITSL